jgi:hypothetical protein
MTELKMSNLSIWFFLVITQQELQQNNVKKLIEYFFQQEYHNILKSQSYAINSNLAIKNLKPFIY